jgi:hypothetical protein
MATMPCAAADLPQIEQQLHRHRIDDGSTASDVIAVGNSLT